MRQLYAFIADESGATAIEYSMIAAIVVVAIVGSVGSIGTKLSTTFSKINSGL
jgi:pilus assembly protein Flp/PilA